VQNYDLLTKERGADTKLFSTTRVHILEKCMEVADRPTGIDIIGSRSYIQ
jgi:hypothetical protein